MQLTDKTIIVLERSVHTPNTELYSVYGHRYFFLELDARLLKHEDLHNSPFYYAHVGELNSRDKRVPLTSELLKTTFRRYFTTPVWQTLLQHSQAVEHWQQQVRLTKHSEYKPEAFDQHSLGKWADLWNLYPTVKVWPTDK